MRNSSEESSAGDEPHDSAQRDAPRPRSRSRYELAHSWTASVVGVLALGLSIYNLVMARQEPDVDVALPHVVRVAQGQDAWVYFQPTLTTRVKSERVEVITQVELRLHPMRSAGRPPQFLWDEISAFTYDAAARNLNYKYVADPHPLLVSQDGPQQPTLLFAASRWTFTAGRYEGALILHKASRKRPLIREFCFVVSKDAEATMRTAGQNRFHSFRDDLHDDAQSKAAKGCYVLAP
ncbi:hypothetical protein ACFWWM_43895 [Streptomyces sp. NPDC058682]|uniref:hypothetical protein n=1 Tax=Streptomyces sp. NPDC058682 TaxID=3346596 RepID=UPI0036577808